VLLILASKADRDGFCRGDRKTLQRWANLDDKEMHQALGNLVKERHVTQAPEGGWMLHLAPPELDLGLTLRERGQAPVRVSRVTHLASTSKKNNTTSSTKSKGTNIAQDYSPDEETASFVARTLPWVDTEAFVDAFRDFWLGKGERRVDWDATLRNHTRRVRAENWSYPKRERSEW
jgi:hypothetical protein